MAPTSPFPDWVELSSNPEAPCRKAFLRAWKSGSKEPELEDIPVGKTAKIVFGRNPEMSDFQLDHMSISRMHAAVLQDRKGVLYIFDLGSTHGTYLNNKRISPKIAVPISKGSQIKFADLGKVFVLGYEGNMPPPEPIEKPTPIEQPKEDRPVINEAVMQQLPVSFGTSKAGGSGGGNTEKPQDAIQKWREMMAAGAAEMMQEIEAQEKKKGEEEEKKMEESEEEEEEEEDDDNGRGFGKGGFEEEKVDSAESIAKKYHIPMTHEVNLQGHTKSITTLAMDPAGSRVAAGGMDYKVMLYDFGGMDKTHKPFRELEPEDGHPVMALSYSPTGDRFLCATGSAQPQVFDREGLRLMRFVKGDPYITDMANTKGHTALVTGGQWHPTEKNIVMTCSYDGTMRIWDLNGKTTFEMLINMHVLKARSARSTPVPVTTAVYNPTGEILVAGCNDGSIQIFSAKKKQWARPEAIIRPAHNQDTVCSLAYSPDGNYLASRGLDDTVKLWDTRKLKAPLKTFSDIMTFNDRSNVVFSPDGRLVAAGTNIKKGKGTGLLKFYETSTASEDAVLQIGVAPESSAIQVYWHPRIKQILIGTSAGNTKVLYDPIISTKGALMSAGRRKRNKDPMDFATVGEIRNPHALPMYQTKLKEGKRRREKDRLDPIKSHRPDLPVSGPGFNGRISGSYSFTQYMLKDKAKNNIMEQDPREEILKYAEKAKEGPQLIGTAYQNTAPVAKFAEKTLEQEQEDMEKEEEEILKGMR